ncbi:alpha/beta hydrolase family protein [Acaryochloris thomasi]|uniref:alpha/beta hydrolase family protein n=1 Tax=Acaryochloris thomasi TaxID=2929456 RepID=UPI0013147DC7|nr:alpha/beta fold hydrolase [Acaryochloris thomasi]
MTSRSLTVEDIPMQLMTPQTAGQHPGVLIAHGFSGSKQLMLGYAYVLVHNGYGVLLWDLPGHGANTQPFVYESLQHSFDVSLSTLEQQPEIDPQRLAALGHSMGGGVALRGGIEHGDQLDAVVAISSTDAPVTPELPKNLNLQIGQWESYLAPYAERLLDQAGGASLDVSQGRGRSFKIIPAVEHATILFSDVSHQESLNWLNQTFGLTSMSTYKDRRMAWYGLHLLGWVVAIASALPTVIKPPSPPSKSWDSMPSPASPVPGPSQPLQRKATAARWSWGGLLFAPVIPIAFLKLLNRQTPIDNLGGLLIGGALGVWMLLAGLVWLGTVTAGGRAAIRKPTIKDLKVGAVGFAMLWLGLGALAQWVWLPWFLVPTRLLLWVAISVACIPWFLASSLVQHQAKRRRRLAWWLGQSLVFLVGLTGTIALLPSLGFLAIMLPVFPLLVALFSLVTAKAASPWGACLACAPIFSWLIVTPFPLV